MPGYQFNLMNYFCFPKGITTYLLAHIHYAMFANLVTQNNFYLPKCEHLQHLPLEELLSPKEKETDIRFLVFLICMLYRSISLLWFKFTDIFISNFKSYIFSDFFLWLMRTWEIILIKIYITFVSSDSYSHH